MMDKKERKQYRAPDEIKALLIEFALRNEKISRYRVSRLYGLSFDQAKNYLEDLERKRFLKRETIGEKKVYSVANRSKCERWLEAFKRLKAIEEE